MISEKDKEVLVRLKDAAEKLRYSHARVMACQYPSKQMGDMMIKMGMHLYCSIYGQLSEEYKQNYSSLGSDLSVLNFMLKSSYDSKDYSIDDYVERYLIQVLDGFEELGI